MILPPGGLALAGRNRIKIQTVFVKSTKCWEEQHICLLCHCLPNVALGFLGLLIRILGGDMKLLSKYPHAGDEFFSRAPFVM